MFALGELGEDPDLLEKGLGDPDWFVRLATVSALARAKPPIPVEAIARLRNDPELLVRDGVRAILDKPHSIGGPKPPIGPKPRSTGRFTLRPITWQKITRQEWSKRERAYVREDMVRRDLSNNFLFLVVVFAIAIVAIGLLSRAGLGEAIFFAVAVSVGLAPLFWVWGWKNGNHPAQLNYWFDVLEVVFAAGWAVLAMAVMAVLARALGWL